MRGNWKGIWRWEVLLLISPFLFAWFGVHVSIHPFLFSDLTIPHHNHDGRNALSVAVMHEGDQRLFSNHEVERFRKQINRQHLFLRPPFDGFIMDVSKDERGGVLTLCADRQYIRCIKFVGQFYPFVRKDDVVTSASLLALQWPFTTLVLDVENDDAY